jgi:hypothetical protein
MDDSDLFDYLGGKYKGRKAPKTGARTKKINPRTEYINALTTKGYTKKQAAAKWRENVKMNRYVPNVKVKPVRVDAIYDMAPTVVVDEDTFIEEEPQRSDYLDIGDGKKKRGRKPKSSKSLEGGLVPIDDMSGGGEIDAMVDAIGDLVNGLELLKNRRKF